MTILFIYKANHEIQYLKQYDNVDEMQEEINIKMTLLIAPLRLRLKVNLLLVLICYLVQIDKSNVVLLYNLTGQFYLLDYLPLTTSKSIRQVQGLTPINHAWFFHDNCFHIFILK